MRHLAFAIALPACLAFAGCAEVDQITGLNTSSLTTQQKVVLASQIVNGLCVLSAAGLNFAGGVNAIVHPNATTGGAGQSTAGTITKASAIGADACQALNGATATLIGTTSAGAAAVAVSQ